MSIVQPAVKIVKEILKKRSQIDKRELEFVRVDAVKGARRDGEE